MKRKAGWLALTALTLLLGWMWRPVVAQLKYAALSVAQTFTALQTFSGGVTASGGGAGGALTVSAGSGIGFEGQAGDTYQKRDADTGGLDTYKDGTLTTREGVNEWIPPDCATSDDPQTFGGFCKDAATGRIRYRDAGGVKELP